MMARTAMLTWSLMTKTQCQRCFGLILNLIYDDDDDDDDIDDKVDDDINELSDVRL